MEIEDDKSIGESQKTQKNTRAASGRKPAHESRAPEFRQALLTWKRTPEPMRPSLRTLGRQLGATHQILAYFLNGLDRWLAKEQAKRIRARAKAEGRGMTMRECLDAIITPVWLDKIEELRQAAKRGPLNHWQIKELKLFAKPGLPGAQEILARCRQMTPEEERQARASERAAHFAQTIERIRRDGERGPLCWQDVERLKYFARRKCVEAKELLEKHASSALPRPQGITQ